MSNPIRGGIRCARCPSWVKSGKARPEHLLSAIPPKADIARSPRDVSSVLEADMHPAVPGGHTIFSNELSSVTQRIHEHAESRGSLSPARIIEVITRKLRTPVGEHAHEPPFRDVCPYLILGQIRQAATRQGRLEPQGEIVERQLTFDVDFHFTTVLPCARRARSARRSCPWRLARQVERLRHTVPPRCPSGRSR